MKGSTAVAIAVALERAVKTNMAALPVRRAFCSSLIENYPLFIRAEFIRCRKFIFAAS